jgi:hypothetical protein
MGSGNPPIPPIEDATIGIMRDINIALARKIIAANKITSSIIGIVNTVYALIIEILWVFENARAITYGVYRIRNGRKNKLKIGINSGRDIVG